MITPIYAAILAIIFVAVSFRILLLRRERGVPIGTASDPLLSRAIRVHSNFAEYVPLSLLLLFFLEQQTNMVMGIHVLGIALITGRLAHAYGLSHIDEDFRFRMFGMVLTLGVIISASARILASYLG